LTDKVLHLKSISLIN